jgi:anti-sigma B factor antagonist
MPWIKRNEIGGITVLSATRNSLSRDADSLVDTLRDLLQEGRNKIVVDLSGIGYIDSSGVGQLAQSFNIGSRLGGKVVFADPSSRIRHILRQLPVHPTVADAMAKFDVPRFELSCPVCQGLWRLLEKSIRDDEQACSECKSRFGLGATMTEIEATLAAGPSTMAIAVSHLWLRTYKEEQIFVELGDVCHIIAGRLDLYTSETIEKAWRLLPLPKRVLFSLRGPSAEFTSEGLKQVLNICNEWTEDARAVFERPPGKHFSAELDAALTSQPGLRSGGNADAALRQGGARAATLTVAVRRANDAASREGNIMA